MLITIQGQNGLRFQGVLLAFNGERMRLALDSERDAVELHRINACWYMEKYALVEIAAVQQIPGVVWTGHSTETVQWSAPGRGVMVA